MHSNEFEPSHAAACVHEPYYLALLSFMPVKVFEEKCRGADTPVLE